ncbi:MAG: ActS/PrrB/RegB family redox-sensitive histidine kinase [Alphaproteobacteria bacterium]|nr:ActS/PrrB/RegB family redox-sensitive histidine kinase [Alphaproteobacteria bacterium]
MAAVTFPTRETSVPIAPRVRLRTLVFLRWLGIAGQSTAIIIVFLGLRYELPVELCAAEIGASVLFNLMLAYLYPHSRQLNEPEAILHLSFDIVQLTALLMLTGGIENPFTLLYIAPVVISATNLRLTATLGLAGFTLACVTLISFLHWPLPWDPYEPLELPLFYLAGNWISLTLGIGFTLIYAWRTADEARGMQTALAVAQEALAREQHLSDLGALAAATAHELGTPLGTIVVVARELEREVPPDAPWLDDIRLLRSQADRCREILGKLAQRDTAEDDVEAQRLPLGALLDEIVEPHRGFGIDIKVTAKGEGTLSVRRRPEVLHALGNLIENAVDFAESAVTVDATWTASEVKIVISDDGPGIDVEVFERLGEPYVTSRGAAQATPAIQGDLRGDHQGMGLGFFIAKTLTERTGGSIDFSNTPGKGAQVTARWPRTALERPTSSKG